MPYAMRNHGKYIVLAIFLLAVALAVGNMLYQTGSARRAVDYWGAGAKLILAAPKVEVLKLQSEEKPGPGEVVQIGSQRLAVVRVVNASRAPGLLHVRRALVSDGLYLWEERPSDLGPQWHYAMRYHDGKSTYTLLLDKECLWLAALEKHDRPIRVRKGDKRRKDQAGVSPLRAFVEQQFVERNRDRKRGPDR